MRNGSRSILVLLLAGFFLAAPAGATEQGPYVGFDLGYSGPINGNYRAHVKGGVTGNPFAGYLFDFKGIGIGPQAELQFTSQRPDIDDRDLPHGAQYTTLIGYLIGLRAQLPLNTIVPLEDYVPYWERIELHTDFLGGGYSGLSGSLKHTAPGFSIGGGLDFYITESLGLGGFFLFNRAYMAPRPTFLINQVPEEQGPADAQWGTVGIALTYRWLQAEAAPTPIPPPPPPPYVVKKKIILRNVNFDFDKSTIRPDAVPIIDEALRLLKEEGEVSIVSAGYTDSIGTEAYNKGLSIRRAQAVKKYLIDHGIAANRIKIEGFGEANPVASNSTPDGRAQNRRVELRLVP